MSEFLKNIAFFFEFLRKSYSFVLIASATDVKKMKTVCRLNDHLMIKKLHIISFLLLASVSAYSQQSDDGNGVHIAVLDSLKFQSPLDSLSSQKLQLLDSLQSRSTKNLKGIISKYDPNSSLPNFNYDTLKDVENTLIGKTEQFNKIEDKVNSIDVPKIDSVYFKSQVTLQEENHKNRVSKAIPEIDTALIDKHTDSTYLVKVLENEITEVVAPQLSELDQNVLGLNSYTDHFAEHTQVIDQLQKKISKKNLNAINLFSKVDTLNKVSLKDRMKVKPRVSVLGLNPVIIQVDGVLIYKLGEELQIGGGLRYQTHISLKDEDDFHIHSTNQTFGGLIFANLQLPKSFGFFTEGFYEFKASSFKPIIGITKEIEILHKALSLIVIYDPKVTETIQFGIRL